MSLVQVDDLQVAFVSRDETVKAVNGVSFSVELGKVLCILGESGSGKSVTLRSLLKLLPPRKTRLGGRVSVDGTDVFDLAPKALGAFRGRTAAMIFQEPMTAFDPVFTAGEQIVETILRHERIDRRAAWGRALELFERVQIPSAKTRLQAYPFELSGGMRQRAMIALALACRPKLLLADEPTTALDATVQIQILLLLRELQRDLDMAVIFVTHDIGVAGEIADDIAVMYAGRVVEKGSARDVIKAPAHPYTQGLLAATVHGAAKGARLQTIAGSPPDLRQLPLGCAFAPRCPHRIAPCSEAVPGTAGVGAGHEVRCIRATELISTAAVPA
ncbi:MAG: ABC transporter ATP-binding protein [Pseudomonadota bacterium]